MAQFHHGVWRPLFGQRSRLLFTDTDSLAYEVRGGRDAYGELAAISHHLDTSSYPEAHPLFSAANAGVTGKFKDELPGKVAGEKCMGVMTEFVGLRAKVYAYRKLLLPWPPPTAAEVAGALAQPGVRYDVEVKRAKGLARAVLASKVGLDTYRGLVGVSLSDLQGVEPEADPPATSTRHEVVKIESRRHQVVTRASTRRSLSAFDDKRHVLPCGKHTLAHGNSMIGEADGEPACPWCVDEERLLL
jgi:hypothetical protein